MYYDEANTDGSGVGGWRTDSSRPAQKTKRPDWSGVVIRRSFDLHTKAGRVNFLASLGYIFVSVASVFVAWARWDLYWTIRDTFGKRK